MEYFKYSGQVLRSDYPYIDWIIDFQRRCQGNPTFRALMTSYLENQMIKNQEEYSELLDSNIAVEEQVFWTHRGEFFLVMKNFLDNITNFDEFETAFTLLYQKTREEFDTFVIDLKQIENFQPSTRSDRFASFINAIFREFEEVEDEYSTEQEVKYSVEKVYLKFQNFLNEE